MAVYAYCRVSTDEQGKSGLSLAHQHRTCKLLGDSVSDKWGTAFYPDDPTKGAVTTEPGFFVDVVSAFRKPIEKRPAGQRLLRILRPGDAIVVARLDRAFRSMADFCKFVQLCIDKEITFVCGSPEVNLSTAAGRFHAKMFALMAEYESDIKSDRIKEALAAKKATGRSVGKLEASPQLESEYRPAKTALPMVVEYDKPPDPGRVFIYIRCSHRDSAASGLGLVAQVQACTRYIDVLVKRYPQLTWDQQKVYVDAAVSALKVQLRDRPQGKLMMKDLQPGDVVVMLRPDRIFGSINDMCSTMLQWKDQGVSIHFAESNMNISSPSGQQWMTILVAFAEYERQLASVRQKEARAVLEGQGKFTGGRKGYFPPFWRQVKRGDARQLVLDANQITTFRLLHFMHKFKKMSLDKALDRLEELIAKRQNRKPLPRTPFWEKKGRGHYNIPNKNCALAQKVRMWTRKRWERAYPVWEATLEMWRAKQQEERQALRLVADRSGHRRHRPKTKRYKEYWGDYEPYAEVAPLPQPINDAIEKHRRRST